MNTSHSTPDFVSQNEDNKDLGKSLKSAPYEVLKLSPNEYCYDIWIFQQGKEGLDFKGVYRNGILNILIASGFRRMYRDKSPVYVREVNNIVEEIRKPQIQDFISGYIFEDSSDLVFQFKDKTITEKRERLKDVYLKQSHLFFNDSFLNNLPACTKTQLKDTVNESYLFFNNGIVKVNKQDVELLPYETFEDYFVWKDQIIERDFQYNADHRNSEFSKFISNVSNDDSVRSAGFTSGLGYLIHNYNDPAKGQAVICYDEELTDSDKPMGGKGKGVFAKAVAEVRKLDKIDGKKFSSNDKFSFQEVKVSTQIILIDDAKRDFDFDRLNSALTDGLNVERKYEHAYTIKGQHAPKVIITSNLIMPYEGTTRLRRQFILEFGSYYSKFIKDGTEEPIMEQHGGRFFTDEWDKIEWDKFYSYLIDALQFYLTFGLRQPPLISVHKNRLMQQTSSEFYTWIGAKQLLPGQTYLVNELFTEFKQQYYSDDTTFKQRKFSEWVKKYASTSKLRIDFKTTNGKNYFVLSEI